MYIIRYLRLNLLAALLFASPYTASAQVAVSAAEWTSVSSFKFCDGDTCETFRTVELSANTVEVGQDISVINLETGEDITKFVVKSIKYGRQVKMCWLGDSEGQSGTYITVGGCKM